MQPVPPNARKKCSCASTGRPGLSVLFARWRIILPTCQDNVTSQYFFHFVHVPSDAFRKLKENLQNTLLYQVIVLYHGLSRTETQEMGHMMAVFDIHSKCARCFENTLGSDPCI